VEVDHESRHPTLLQDRSMLIGSLYCHSGFRVSDIVERIGDIEIKSNQTIL